MDTSRATIRDWHGERVPLYDPYLDYGSIALPAPFVLHNYFGFYPAPDGEHCFVPMQDGIEIHD
jgi:hypothetical protein